MQNIDLSSTVHIAYFKDDIEYTPQNEERSEQ